MCVLVRSCVNCQHVVPSEALVIHVLILSCKSRCVNTSMHACSHTPLYLYLPNPLACMKVHACSCLLVLVDWYC